VSITNPSEDSPLPYFHGKAVVEKALRESGLSYAILRPAVLFGREDILVNNIAWTLRRFPVFGMFGNGNYRLRPIFVDDLAKLAVEQGENRENKIIDAVGPETFTYRDLVIAIGDAIGKRRLIMPVPPVVAYFAGRMMGVVMRDILLTRDEIKGLMADLLYVDSEPAGETRLTVWMRDNAESLGKRYANELVRRRGRLSEY
jgi:NADH dehydrogenase